MAIPCRRGNGGFTLIEMIVVIAVMAMIGGLVMMRQPWRSTGLNMDATERALAGALRLARSRAIAQDRAVSVVTGAAQFSVDGAAAWVLPSGEVMSETQVVFLPRPERFLLRLYFGFIEVCRHTTL
jgi:general secretion pathway protein H